MRIRAGFVSNSSSTSFLIITRDELEEGPFLELMGVLPDSPIAGLFQELFRDVMLSSSYVDFAEPTGRRPPETWFADEYLSEKMTERLREAAAQGLKAYAGRLSSDNTPVQTFFCTDAFEVENERIYFNYLNCGW